MAGNVNTDNTDEAQSNLSFDGSLTDTELAKKIEQALIESENNQGVDWYDFEKEWLK